MSMQITTHLTLNPIHAATCQNELHLGSWWPRFPHDIETPSLMIIPESTCSKHPQITWSVTPYSKSCKNMTKKSEKIESRYSCSAPLLISETCATRIKLTPFWRCFTTLFYFVWSLKAVWMMTILRIWFVSPLFNMMTF